MFFILSVIMSLCSCEISKVHKIHGDENKIAKQLTSNSTYFADNFGKFEENLIEESIIESYKLVDDKKYAEQATIALEHARKGLPEKAQELLILVIEQNKKSKDQHSRLSDLYTSLAYLYFLSDLEQGLKFLQKAVLYNPSRVAINELLGFYYYNDLEDLEKRNPVLQ